jgi:Rad3-related DNA helicase
MTPRPDQVAGLQFIERHYDAARPGKYGPIPVPIVMNCPTAWGKTAIGACAAEFLASKGKRVVIVSPQNTQLDQYKKEYPHFAMLKGRSNYQCVFDTGKNCEEMNAKEMAKESFCEGQCTRRDECTYEIAKREAMESSITLCNFHSFHYNRDKLNMRAIIVDEWHRLPDFLKDLSVMNITSGFKYEDLENLSILRVQQIVAKKKSDLIEKAMKEKDPKRQHSILKHCEKKFWVVEQMFQNDPENIGVTVRKVDRNEDGKKLSKKKDAIVINPISPSRLMITTFFSGIDTCILMSGTGFETDEQKLKFFHPNRFAGQSPIAPQRRPVFTTNEIAMSRKKRDEFAMISIAKAIRTIVKHHYPMRGIILTTYAIAIELKNYLHEPYYQIHDTDGRKEMIANFKDSMEYMIPILCGSYEGLDFKDTIANFCIIPKVPFANLLDPTVKRQADSNKEQYMLDALTLIVQGSARVCRGPHDYGPTYLLDKAFIHIYETYKHLLPAYFCQAVCHSGTVETALSYETYIRMKILGGKYADKRLPMR